jgi:hypothetical protein
MWKEAIAHFKISSWHLPVGTEENHRRYSLNAEIWIQDFLSTKKYPLDFSVWFLVCRNKTKYLLKRRFLLNPNFICTSAISINFQKQKPSVKTYSKSHIIPWYFSFTDWCLLHLHVQRMSQQTYITHYREKPRYENRKSTDILITQKLRIKMYINEYYWRQWTQCSRFHQKSLAWRWPCEAETCSQA